MMQPVIERSRGKSRIWLPPGHGEIRRCGGMSRLLGRPRLTGGGGTWTPASLPSLWGYYDAGVIGSLWQDTAGTNPITTNGQSIARVDDLSGNGRHLLQSYYGFEPDYGPTGFAGAAAVHGSGGTNLNTPAGITGAQTWGISFKLQVAPSYGVFFALASLYTGSVGGIIYLCQYPGYAAISFGCSMVGTTALVGFNPTLDAGIHSLIITYSGSGSGPSSYTCDYDGVSQSLSATSGAAPTTTWGAIGALRNADYGMPGYWRRAAFSNAQASSGDRANLSTWLAG